MIFHLNTFEYLTTNNVLDFDLDHNGQKDEIIVLSSMEESENVNNYYNLVVLIFNGEVKTLIEERGLDATYVYSLVSDINMFDNTHDSFIISKLEGYISENPTKTNLVYSFKNNEYMID